MCTSHAASCCLAASLSAHRYRSCRMAPNSLPLGASAYRTSRGKEFLMLRSISSLSRRAESLSVSVLGLMPERFASSSLNLIGPFASCHKIMAFHRWPRNPSQFSARHCEAAQLCCGGSVEGMWLPVWIVLIRRVSSLF